MDNLKYGPADLKGREFKDGDGWIWYYVTFENKAIYCKLDKEGQDKAIAGEPFMAYNPWVFSKEGWIYLPAISMVIEPLFIHKASCVAFVHWQVCSDLDNMCKNEFSPIVQLDKEIKTVPKLII